MQLDCAAVVMDTLILPHLASFVVCGKIKIDMTIFSSFTYYEKLPSKIPMRNDDAVTQAM